MNRSNGARSGRAPTVRPARLSDAQSHEALARRLEEAIAQGADLARLGDVVGELYRTGSIDIDGALGPAGMMPVVPARDALAQAPGARDAGHPLSPDVRRFLESCMGVDLSTIRVHDDAAASSTVRSFGTDAVASGASIYLGNPGLASDLPLMAHEVSHIVTGAEGIACHGGEVCQGDLDMSLLADRVNRLLAELARSDESAASTSGVSRIETLYSECGETLGFLAEALASGEYAAEAEPLALTLMDSIDAHARCVLMASVNANDVSGEAGFERTPVDLPSRQRVMDVAGRVRDIRSAGLGGERDCPEVVETADRLQDAMVGVLQAMSTEKARDTWSHGVDSRGEEVKDVIVEGSGTDWGTKPGKDGKKLPEWCGIFASSAWHSAGIDTEVRRGIYSAQNVVDMFSYKQHAKADRAPLAIWDDVTGSWRPLREYHEARGSVRRWLSRDDLVKILGDDLDTSRLDIRSGDIVLTDYKHSSPTLDESGNPVLDENGKPITKTVNQADGIPDHVTMVESFQPSTGCLRTIEGNTGGGIVPYGFKPKGSSVQVHERDVKKQTAGWDGEFLQEGETRINGVGRPSLCDFEDHDYAVRLPPKELRSLSPDQIRAVAAGDLSQFPEAEKDDSEKARLKKLAKGTIVSR